MALVESLLTAIVRSDGDALVMHVGEKPYVVASSGPVELSRQGLNLGAMEGMLAQLLPAEALRALAEFGAIEHELASMTAGRGDRFTVVAARGGDDIWIELRRHRRLRLARTMPMAADLADVAAVQAAPAPIAPLASVEPSPVEGRLDSRPEFQAAVAVEGLVEQPEVAVQAPSTAPSAPTEDTADAIVEVASVDRPSKRSGIESLGFGMPVPMAGHAAQPAVPEPTAMSAVDEVEVPREMAAGEAAATPAVTPPSAVEPVAPHAPEAVGAAPPSAATAASTVVDGPQVDELDEVFAIAGSPSEHAFAEALEEVARQHPAAVDEAVAQAPAPAPPAPIPAPSSAAMPSPTPLAPPPAPAAVPSRAAAQAPVGAMAVASSAPTAASPATPAATAAPDPAHAPMANAAPVAVPPAAPTGTSEPAFDRSLSRERASTEEPMDEPSPAVVLPLSRAALRSEPLSRGGNAVRPGGIERLLRLASARGAQSLYLTTQARPAVRVDGDIRLLDGEPPLSSGDVEAAVLELMPEGSREYAEAEWIRDLPEVGRVRITTFRDYRGPGALFRMISTRATSAEQLGLVREIQALATEPEGLVIVTGPRGSGKSTLLAAFVDLINRQRNDYVITLEGQIRLVHESRGSLISQRELRGNADEVMAAARAALRENPDVLVIEDLKSPDVLRAALDAAGSGLLVFVSVTAASATASLERLVDLCPAEQRKTVRAALAEHLRGVVAQVLLRKSGGGRLAARELVLNTAAVAALVGDGQISQLPRAIDSGRKHGMVPLNDALVAFVQSGAVDVREAYRRADDKVGLLALLKREGIDTSFVERLA